jgi:hypothetical protein
VSEVGSGKGDGVTASTIPPGVIPYIDVHQGPRRLVTISIEGPRTPLAGMTVGQIQPNLFVDGRQFIVSWGQVTVEVPADRSVHLGIGLQDGLRGASLLLEPGADAAHLHYRLPATGPAVFERVGRR